MNPQITHERWLEAQKAEREFHDKMSYIEKVLHYCETYKKYFNFLGIDNREVQYSVLEVGPADVPALLIIPHYDSAVCDPLPSPDLDTACKFGILKLYDCKLEDLETEDDYKFSEVWLFNVMQHIYDPIAFVEKAKQLAPVIRFFEPIDWPIEPYHPYTYTIDDFKGWFGDCVQFYKGGSEPNFHEANCAYGVWRKDV